MTQTPGSLTYAEQCAYEVEWYRKHGKHKSRIQKNARGMKFVMGDWRWNRDHPRAKETIGPALAEYVGRQMTGLKA